MLFVNNSKSEQLTKKNAHIESNRKQFLLKRYYTYNSINITIDKNKEVFQTVCFVSGSNYHHEDIEVMLGNVT